jgi:hypothetical protein
MSQELHRRAATRTRMAIGTIDLSVVSWQEIPGIFSCVTRQPRSELKAEVLGRGIDAQNDADRLAPSWRVREHRNGETSGSQAPLMTLVTRQPAIIRRRACSTDRRSDGVCEKPEGKSKNQK